MHNVAAVIVLYNPSKEETANVRRLSGAHNGVIVDNSPEPAFQGDRLGKMHYVSLQENMGIAKAQNIGCRYVLDHTDATHIVFLDQDSTVPDSYPEEIVNCFEKIKRDFPRLAFLGPATENKETGKAYKSVIHKDHALSADFIPRRELISSGGCTTREVLEAVGLNDERLFIDYVDFEWCWRARSKGFICGFTPNVTIKHMVGLKTIYICGYTIIVSSPIRYYYQFRNHLWLLRRSYVPLQWKINHAIKHLARLIYFPIFIKSGCKCWINMVKGLAAGISSPKCKKMNHHEEGIHIC
ncbi:MAG: glycosyltransferase family 2 protein [Bacteroidaceae bacterium]|nr:glycosyltransferase family 2 protein [Bacteroidaceae bacterium]